MHNQANRWPTQPLTGGKERSAEELLVRVVDRDVEVLGTLYDRFSCSLMGLLMHIMSVKADAESVLQEVFLRLWKEAPGIAHAQGSVAVWLVLTARHIALHRLRAGRRAGTRAAKSPDGQSRAKDKKAARKQGDSTSAGNNPRETRSATRDSESLSFLAGSPQCWLPHPQDIALVDARMGLLRKAFGHIPEPQRNALDLAVFGGYTEAEIAERLGEPMGKVRAALRAAFTFVRHRQHAVLGTWTADI